MSPAGPRGVFVVGAGRLGRTLALALARGAGGFRLAGTWNRGEARARQTRRLLRGLTHGPCSGGELPPGIRKADLVLLCAGDDALGSLARRLAERGRIGPGQTVAHCAGALDLSVLEPCAREGAAVGSLHPLRAFVDPAEDLARLPGTLAVLEGEAEALPLLEALAGALSLRTATLAGGPRARARYHAAAVNAAGNLCALMDASLELAAGAGLSRDDALSGLLALSRGVLEAIEREGDPARALTGPVARGDEAVLAAHREALRGLPADLRKVYELLIARSRRLAGRR
ncbi:MAG: DUF2520 domain-containing protein [Deltaproteobacteria bacterium]|nr:DUF2520 domain-containing protein [Deltaproteobacteria bacterium]